MKKKYKKDFNTMVWRDQMQKAHASVEIELFEP